MVSEKKVSDQENAYWLKPVQLPLNKFDTNCYDLPFIETWDSASFDYQEWEVTDYWDINTDEGNPEPVAKFSTTNPISNYNCFLKTSCLNSHEIINGKVLINFDLRLDNEYETGTEYFKVILLTENNIYPLEEYSNDDSLGSGWNSFSIDVTTIAKQEPVQVIFLASGQNTANINAWYLDNIEVVQDCFPVQDYEVYYENPDPYIFIDWLEPGYMECNWLNYNDGTFENGLASDEGGEGLAQLFYPFGYPATITKIKWYYESGTGREEVYILSGDGNEILGGPYYYQNSITNSSWVEMEIDPVTITEGNFMVATINTNAGGPFVGVDDSYYDGSLLYGSIGSWTELSEVGDYYYIGSHRAYIEVGDTIGLGNLLGYNLYRNHNFGPYFMISDSLFNETEYTDQYHGGNVCYYLEAVYSECIRITDTICVFDQPCVNTTMVNALIYVFPNPVSKTLQINCSNEIYSIFLYTSQGAIIFNKQNLQTKEYSIDVSGYPGGLYFLKIRTEEGEGVYKVIVG